MTDYNKLKVTELRDILKERGIPSTGLSRKQQIVEALEAHDSAQNGGEEAAEDATEAEAEEDVATAQEEAGARLANGAEPAPPPNTEPPASEDPPALADIADLPDGDIATTSPRPTTTEFEDRPISPPSADMPGGATATTSPKPQATVLEHNEPLSKEPSALTTPQRGTSPGAESQSSDTRKRKRRSPTPPPSAESVNKKLKAAQDDELVVKLPEDTDAVEEEQGVVAVDRSAEGSVLQQYLGDDTAETKMEGMESSAPEAEFSSDQQPPSATTLGDRIPPSTMEEDTSTTTPPALHPATRALYIANLVRPLQSQQLRDHLLELATPPSGSLDDSIIESFHLDTLRTHAFASFTSVSAASRVRSKLHDQIWPDDPTRKALWVDFVPEEKVNDWIETETSTSSGRNSTKKWEVIYNNDINSGEVIAEFREVASGSANNMYRQPSISDGPAQSTGIGMPNAPLGPRAIRPPPSPAKPQPVQSPSKQPASSSFTVLDERFSSTSSKPQLYYKPVDSDLVNARMDALESATSKAWDGRVTGEGDDLRRYTFEDGARLVDGGVDIGHFGRDRGFGGGSRGGSGGFGGGYRGRGGGFRGGRW